MTTRRDFLQDLAVASVATTALPGRVALSAKATGSEERRYWLEVLQRIARPVLNNLAQRQLKIKMPIEARPTATDRHKYSHLEALGRLLAGIAPWLELNSLTGAEERLRNAHAELARAAIA